MKNVQHYVISLVLLVGLGACEYEPEGVNFNDVDPTPINTMQVDLNQAGDTILVATLTEIAYTFTFPRDVNFQFSAYLGGKKIFQSNQRSSTFTISAWNLENGFYPLTFEVDATSGTGSLADRVRNEWVRFNHGGKIVQIEKSPPQKLDIISITKQQDGLLITWPKYPKKNLKEIILHKTVTPLVRGYAEFGTWHFSDANVASFVDHDFLGGNAQYSLEVITMDGASAINEVYTFRGERSVIKDFLTESFNKLKVRWSKSEYPQAFGSYHLLEDYGYGPGDYFTSGDINDTIAIIADFPFGKPVNAELRTQPLQHDVVRARDGTYSTFGEIYLGDKIPADIKVLNLKNPDLLYYYSHGYMYVMRHTDVKPYDSLAVNLNISSTNNAAAALSPNGEYLYVSTGQNLIRLNPITLDKISALSLLDIFNGNFFPYTIAVSDDHRLIVDVRGGQSHHFIAIMDGPTGIVSDTIWNDVDIRAITTSHDQQYVFVDNFTENKIFEISAAGLELRRETLSRANFQAAFFDADKIYLLDAVNTNVFDLSNFVKQASFQHPHFNSYAIDPLTGRLGALTDQFEYTIYDPLTMNVVHKIPVTRYSNSPDTFIQLVNNRLISSHGYRLALP